MIVASGLLPAADFFAAAIRHWVGDVIGITVVTPFALFALTRRSILPTSREAWLQMLAIGAALAIVFGFVDEEQFQLFYVLFLPIIWVAVRTGTEGVSVAILVTQLGLIAGIQFFPSGTFNVTSFQALMLVLAITGLITGELVTEHRRTQSQLRRPPRVAVAPCEARQHGRTCRRGGARAQSTFNGRRHLHATA